MNFFDLHLTFEHYVRNHGSTQMAAVMLSHTYAYFQFSQAAKK